MASPVHSAGWSRAISSASMSGSIYQGWVGDSAWTYAGRCRSTRRAARLMEATEGSLWAGIAQARPGKHLADISRAVEEHVVATRLLGGA